MTWWKWIRKWLRRMWAVAVMPLALASETKNLLDLVFGAYLEMARLERRMGRIERHLHLDNVLAHANTGKNRNRKCFCGSGKKQKNCHGRKGKRG